MAGRSERAQGINQVGAGKFSLFFVASFVTRLILARLRDRFLDLGCRCRKMDSCGRR